MLKHVKLFCLLISMLALSACAGLQPFVQDLNIISLEEERTLSQQLAAEIEKEMTLIKDPDRLLPITMLGNRLVSVLPRRDFDYRFYLVEDRTPNAFTIPGGRIYVHTGLLDFAADGNELAGVIAHEIGHAYERHPAKNLSRAYGMQFLASLIMRNNQNQLKALMIAITGQGILSKYSRDDEREADDIGTAILQKAGMNTDGLLRFLKKLESAQRGGHPVPFLSTHPPTPERIERLEKFEIKSAW